jgi:hypothetical protein
MWTSTSKAMQSNEVQKGKIAIEFGFFKIHYHVWQDAGRMSTAPRGRGPV